MENTNINETQTTNATQTESGEKLFTQEQVNQIVSERLARERSKAATEQATTDREKALDAREQALKCRELVAGDKRYRAHTVQAAGRAGYCQLRQLQGTGGQAAGSVPPHGRHFHGQGCKHCDPTVH